MNKLIAIISFLFLCSCSTTTSFKGVGIYNQTDVAKHIVNTKFTIYWVYCGTTENGTDIILKRNSGKPKSPGDLFYESFRYHWYQEDWFKVKSHIIDIPTAVTPGVKMILTNGKFIIKT